MGRVQEDQAFAERTAADVADKGAGELVREGKYWSIAYEDGTTVKTGHKSLVRAELRQEALDKQVSALPANTNTTDLNATTGTATGTATGTTTDLNATATTRRAEEIESRPMPNSGTSNTTTDGIPAWVDPDYGYDPANPRKPNMREMMEMIAGMSVEEMYASGEDHNDIGQMASDLLYGVVGSNGDTRDFVAITNSATDATTGEFDANKFVAATQIATAQMYGGTTVVYEAAGYEVDAAGNTRFDANGKPILVAPQLIIKGNNGTYLRSLTGDADKMALTLKTFGVQDVSWIDGVSSSMGDKLNPKTQQAFGILKETYNPFGSFQDLFNTEGLITGVAPTIDNFKIVSGKTSEEGTKVVEETIKAPQSTAVTPDTVATAADIPSTVSSVSQSVTAPTYPTSPTTTYTTPTTQVTPQTVATNTVKAATPATTGTMGTPLQTAGLSAVPSTIQVNPNVTGTTMANLTSQSQKGFGGVVKYRNSMTGQEIMISIDAQGNPLTMVPPGYTKVQGQAEGGSVAEDSPDVQLARKFLGFNGPSSQLTNFLAANPASAARMGRYQQAMSGMAQKRVGAQTGLTGTSLEDFQKMQQNLITQTMQPLPATVNQITPQAADFVAPTAGQTAPVAPMANVANVGRVQQAALPTTITPSTMTPKTVAEDVANLTQGGTKFEPLKLLTAAVKDKVFAGGMGPSWDAQKGKYVQGDDQMGVPYREYTPSEFAQAYGLNINDFSTTTEGFNATQGTITPGATINAQQQETTSVANVEAAQGTAIKVSAPDPREIQLGEIIDVDKDVIGQAQKAATFNEQIQAATATPTKQATVAGQLEGLMAQFEGGNTPAWAAGAMRSATAAMVARGLGASSMAGQAIVQAAMESALPIAQMDASVMAQFEVQNLSNRQQRAILAAQQRAQFLGQEFDQAFQARVANSARIGDIANMNFTAEQQIALEDSRAANTMSLSNLSNRQALVMAEAAALSQLDIQNLNNRQQTAVQNAQNFLQMDMTNLANTQQTELFKTQQNIQALFTDQAATNASAQFNATSESQTNQFFASLSNQTSQFNSAQQNAMDQFNVNSTNAMRQFNSEVQQQRDLFNAQNGLVIAQANAQWRQNLATVNTSAVNQANMDFAKTINAMSMKNLDEIWQRERDIMSFAFTSDQSAMDRALQVIMGDKELDIAREKLNSIKKADNTELAMRFLFGTSPDGVLGAISSLNPFK